MLAEESKMKVPNAHLAQVDGEKIVNYLLKPAHRYPIRDRGRTTTNDLIKWRLVQKGGRGSGLATVFGSVFLTQEI